MSGIVVGGIVLLLFLMVGLTWIFGRRAKAELAAKYPPPGQMVDVGGYRMHINCQGRKRSDGSPTVVLEAGHSESSLTWALVQRGVAKFTRVCTYDRAGLGWSERSPKPRTATNIVAELHALLTQMGVEPPYVLVGHSIGGLFARLYAHEHPDQVVGMVLVDATHDEQDVRHAGAVAKQYKLAFKVMAWLFRLLQMLNSIGLLALIPNKVSGIWPNPIPKETREAYIGVVCSSTRWFETARKEAATSWENIAAARAAQITTLGDIPLIVLSAGQIQVPEGPGISATDAEQFKAVQMELQAELVTLSSKGKRMIAEKSAHFIQVEQPEAVIDAIRQVVEAAGR